MGQIEHLVQNYDARVSLPWKRNLVVGQCVWFAVYGKPEEPSMLVDNSSMKEKRQ